MNASTSKSVFAVLIAVSVLLGAQWTWAGSLPVWGGTTTTKQPQVQQPSKPFVSEPGKAPAQTVQPTQQPGLRTSPVTTRPLAVSTPVQQRVSNPQIGEAETPMSIAQDECVVFLQSINFDYGSGVASGGFSGPMGGVSPGAMADAMGQAMASGASYDIKRYMVLEKGDYQVTYLPELLYIQNLNKNNPAEFLVRLPGIDMSGSGPDDWTKGRKNRITLRPGEHAQFDYGSGTTLIKVRCP